MVSFNTCGSGRRHTLRVASASALTRVSLYFQVVPGAARAREPLGGRGRRAVGPVGLAPQRAFPVARLAQHVVPGDLAVVRRVEELDQVRAPADALGLVAGGDGIEHLDRRHVVAHGVVEAPDHAAIEGHADHARQEALGHAVRHVDARGLAPLRDDEARVHDDAGHGAARLHRADRVTEGLPAEGLVVVHREVAWVPALRGYREVDRVLEARGVHAAFFGRAMFPARAGIVGVERARLRAHSRGEQQQRDERGEPASEGHWTIPGG